MRFARPARRTLSTIAGSLLLAGVTMGRAAELPVPAPLGDPTSKVFRQIGRDGSVIYSDRPLGHATLDGTLTVEPPVHGSGWMAQPGKGVQTPDQVIPTPVARRAALSGQAADRPRTLEEADASVMRAEMLLEEARSRLSRSPSGGNGIDTAPGDAMPDDPEHRRLRRHLAEAEQAWIDAVKERHVLRGAGASRVQTSRSAPDAATVSRGYERLKD